MHRDSPENVALRHELARAFEQRGYSADSANATFLVAYFASVKDTLTTANWYFGDPDSDGYRFVRQREETVSEYARGTVIVYVLDAKSGHLLWRGRAVSRVSDDPKTDVRELAKTVSAIVDKFPRSAH